MPNDLTSTGRQWKLEAEASRLGAERLRERTRAAESREFSSGTVWGKPLINQQIAGIADKITATKKRLTQGKAQPGAVKLWDMLNLIEPEVLAAIAAKRTLDLIGLGKTEKGKYNNTYTKVCITIGRAVEAEARFRWYEHVASADWKACKAKYFKPTTGTRQREVISKTIMKRRGYEWERWSEPRVLQVGAFLLDCIAQTVNWFSFDKSGPQGKSSYHRIEISPELKNLKDHIMALAELQAPLCWPMVCEPADWSNTQRGGYLTNELRQGFRLIRGQRCTPTLGKHPLEMLNTLQRVGYRMNPVTYQLMKQLEERGLDLDSFVMRDNETPRPRPETEDPEILFEWRKDATEAYNRNAALKGKRYRTLETISTADRFHTESVFYVPWSYDYRGRVYPLISYMSPQGTGMEKSLYLFADAQPVNDSTERWLAIHLANTAGHDKLPLDERVQWVKDHESLIARIAQDPLGNLAELEGFDDSWCGAAACDEYYHVVMLKDRTETSLPIATDATCSGLQHLCSMTLDSETARLVNVLPGNKPQDAYKAVLAKTIDLLNNPSAELRERVATSNQRSLDNHRKAVKAANEKGIDPPAAPAQITLPRPDLAEWGADVGRKLAKRVVMTVPYSATPHSNRGYIREAIMSYEQAREKQIQVELDRFLKREEKRRPSGQDLTLFTQAMLLAMEAVVPGPIKVMNWIKEQIGQYFTGKDVAFEWDTPSGFHVIQDKRHLNMVRVRTQLLGNAVSNFVGDGVKGVNKDKHMSCAAPNFIHSMDAALLHLSFAGYDKPFTLIHDSILTTASDMEEMAQVIRDQFREIYSKDADGLIPLEQYARVLGVETPAHLIAHGFDIDQVNESTYFFC